MAAWPLLYIAKRCGRLKEEERGVKGKKKGRRWH
jgi:hypothetical protein